MIVRPGATRTSVLVTLAATVIVVGAMAIILFGPTLRSELIDREPGVPIKLKLVGASGHPRLIRDEAGDTHYVVKLNDGSTITLTPSEFTARLYHDRATRPWWARLLNVSSAFGIAWVALGLLGQALFAGRMIVQWLVSERSKRSVVPVAFWWMSLGGASMLLTYFVWRKDVVGVLGQGTGWMIYLRNLALIYSRRPKRDDVESASDAVNDAEPHLVTVRTTKADTPRSTPTGTGARDVR